MEKYIEPIVDVVAFDNEDVITTSGNASFALPEMMFGEGDSE